jgi:YD repeat-containing protein
MSAKCTGVTNLLGGVTTTAYDAAGYNTTFAYDAVNRLSSTTDRDGRARNFGRRGRGFVGGE